MKNKQPFTIGGSAALRRAISEDSGVPAFNTDTFHLPYITPMLPGILSGCNHKGNTHYQLPQDWDKAIKAVKDFFQEEEAKPQTLVLKGMKITQEIDTFTVSEKTVDLHLTATHLQQLKAYFSK
jgi:hypothetical protein